MEYEKKSFKPGSKGKSGQLTSLTLNQCTCSICVLILLSICVKKKFRYPFSHCGIRQKCSLFQDCVILPFQVYTHVQGHFSFGFLLRMEMCINCIQLSIILNFLFFFLTSRLNFCFYIHEFMCIHVDLINSYLSIFFKIL